MSSSPSDPPVGATLSAIRAIAPSLAPASSGTSRTPYRERCSNSGSSSTTARTAGSGCTTGPSRGSTTSPPPRCPR
ncbi:hypothetical protein EEB14_37545 [Rhodococcus sp. WS4]|nr:hypothetical protein EEB14_37545 [Rhodococcus sp. WS4]